MGRAARRQSCSSVESEPRLNQNQWAPLVEIFLSRLVLEVFGAAGAIWGFSEALTLRNSDTVWFWRPCALTVGAIFFCRWLIQIRDCMIELKQENARTLNQVVSMMEYNDHHETSNGEMNLEHSELLLKLQYETNA